MASKFTGRSCRVARRLNGSLLIVVSLFILFSTNLSKVYAQQPGSGEYVSETPQTQTGNYINYLPMIQKAKPLPGAFSKHAPANGSLEVALSPILSWNSSANATMYEYCYDTTNDGSCTNWNSTGTNTYAGLWGLLPGTTYYWQVRSWNGTTGPTYAEGSSSSFWRFSTLALNTIQNGGFESGHVEWQEYSSNGFYLILNTSQDLPISPHSGSWLAWLGGYPDESSVIIQTVRVPAGRSVLHFWLYLASEDYCGYDAFGVMVNDDVVYEQWACYSNNTYGWVRKTVDLSAYVGQSVELAFLAILDWSYNSSVFLDDISFEAAGAMSTYMDGDSVPDNIVTDPTQAEIHKITKDRRYSETASPDRDFEMFINKVRQLQDYLLTQ